LGLYVILYFFDFVWWVYCITIYDICIFVILLFASLCYLLDSHTVGFDICFVAFFTWRRKLILCFTYMAKSKAISVNVFVIIDTYTTVMTLWNMSAIMTDDTRVVSFFVSDDQDTFILFEVFVDSLLCELWKMVVQLFGHIYEENIFCLPIYCWGKLFVVHSF